MTKSNGFQSTDKDGAPDRAPSVELDMSNGSLHRGEWRGQIEFILTLVSYAVGVGNIWRFPYLCMRNGGGAFLIPYFIALLVCGIPLFYLEVSIGQFSSLSPVRVWNMCPLFRGLGWGAVMITTFCCIYYNVITTWVVYYLIKSFMTIPSTVPWASCGKSWNTPCCVDGQTGGESGNFTMNSTLACTQTETNNSSDHWTSPSEEFWEHNVLEISRGITDLGGIKWDLAGCLVLSWTVVFLCLCKGIKSLGRVVYVTATAPYIFLTIILIRSLLLEGAIDGIKYYIIPKWGALLDLSVWAEACTQVFYSLGPAWGGIITMASYNKFTNNCRRDAVIVPVINCGTSFYGGFVVFSAIGFMAKQQGVPVDQVLTQGPGLAFITYPDALSKLPVSPLWAILFFLMMLNLGLGTMFTQFEMIVSSIIDSYPKLLQNRHVIVTLVLCVIQTLLGLPMITRAGIYIFQVMDWYLAIFSVMIISSLECVVVAWIYGFRRFSDDIEAMTGGRPSLYFIVCWCGVTPVMLIGLVTKNALSMSEPHYGDYYYPPWVIALGWMFACSTIIPLPVFMIKEICQKNGSFIERVRASLSPTTDWGPSSSENKAHYKKFLAKKYDSIGLESLHYNDETKDIPL